MKLEDIQILILSILGYEIHVADDVKESIKMIANLAKKAHLISVDITELFFNKFDLVRFFFGIVDLIFLLIYLIFSIVLYNNDSLYKLIDNEFLPKNFKVTLIALIFIYSFCICVRFDLMTSEWNHKLEFLKMCYFFAREHQRKTWINRQEF